jgi:hypothetical protein
MNDPTKILWEIISKEEQPKSDKSGWELRKGVKIFTNPEAKCPNCETWIPTQRIWLVDNSAKKLLGCWRMDGTKVIADGRKSIIHPHVYHNGEVCKGTTDSASTALFSGIDRGKHYHLTEHWFEQIGHVCPNVEKVPCAWCGYRQFYGYCEIYGDEDESHKSFCSWDCLHFAEALWCWLCFSPRDFYDPKVGEKHLCSSCRDKGFLCYCDKCRTAMCRECCGMFRPDDLDTERLCERCESGNFLCGHCGENEVDEEGWVCDDCCCRECGEEIDSRSERYCSSHFYECSCNCECIHRIDSPEDICIYCLDNCRQEEEEEEED